MRQREESRRQSVMYKSHVSGLVVRVKFDFSRRIADPRMHRRDVTDTL